MMARIAIDSNVLVVANYQNEKVTGTCLDACIERVAIAMLSDTVLIDEDDEVLAEYLKAIEKETKPQRRGAEFLLWLIDKSYSGDQVQRINLTKLPNGEFVDCPASLVEAGFDVSDRKFVALARSGRGRVVNATDSDWLEHALLLAAEQVDVDNICGCTAAEMFNP